MARKKKTITVGFYALGCPKNVIDSERMLAEIAEDGLVITTEADNADVIVINTCGFIAPAKAEAIETIKHVVNRKQTGAVKKVIVAGCLPQRLGTELFGQADCIDAIVGLGQRDEIARIIRKTLASDDRGVFLNHQCRETKGYIPDDRIRLRITDRHWAYLRISEGCDHRCAFCTIPTIRGRFRSKPERLVLDEANELANAGVVELNIIAQDTTYYGRDLGLKNGLAKLAKKLDKIDDLRWIRLLYLYPAGTTDELIAVVATGEKIAHYFDIPIQHINNRILKSMRRKDTREGIYRLIEKLRAAMPDVVLRTTIIVGLPGETDECFAELIDFIEWAKFDCLGCFKYYPESGTKAARMPGQVSEQVKRQRLQELMLTQQRIAFAGNKSRIGTELSCLIDSVDERGAGQGRFYGQAPEIDGVCIIENCSSEPGRFISARVVDTRDYDLLIQRI